MRPRERVVVRFWGTQDGQEVVHAAVTSTELREGALIVGYDGEDGPEQVIYAAGAWRSATSKLEPASDA